MSTCRTASRMGLQGPVSCWRVTQQVAGTDPKFQPDPESLLVWVGACGRAGAWGRAGGMGQGRSTGTGRGFARPPAPAGYRL